MRHAWCASLLLLAAGLAHAQLNPATQIAWPPSCYSNPGAVYGITGNICFVPSGGPGGGLPVNNPAFTGTMTGPTITLSNYIAAKNLAVSILSFGAKCDGTTDDTSAFNAAWASINTAGGEIDLPTGTCYVPGGWKMNQLSPNSNTVRIVKGQGMYQSKILTHNAPISVEMGGMVNVVLEDLWIFDNGTLGGGSQAGVAQYRTDWTLGYAGQCGGHVFNRVEIGGPWALAGLFSVGCEVNSYSNISIHAGGPGTGLYINSTNGLGLTTTLPINAVGASDTVNHFYGGAILNYGTGPSVYFGNGSADDVSFTGTYFDASGTIADIQFGGLFGGNSNDEVQGSKSFHTVRFEASTGDCMGITASGLGPLTIDSGTTFGCPGKDINQTNTSWAGGSSGLVNADIHGISASGHGMTLGDITSSNITAYSDTITILNNAYVSESHLEAKGYAFPSNYTIDGSTWTQNDNTTATGGMKMYWGPGGNNNTVGSVMVLQPFTNPPASPVNGELAMADGSSWKPGGTNAQILAQYRASDSSWQPVGALPFNYSANTFTTTTLAGTTTLTGPELIGSNNLFTGLSPTISNMFLDSNMATGKAAIWTDPCQGVSSTMTPNTGAVLDPQNRHNALLMVPAASGGSCLSGVASMTQGVPLVSGQTYTVSGWLRGVAGGVTAAFDVQGGASSPFINPTTSWARYNFTFTATSTSTQNVQVLANGGIYIYGMDLENASTPGLYAITTGAAIPMQAGMVVGGLLVNPVSTNVPTVSAGTITGNNAGGIISGLSAAASVTITFANGGWSSWASCTGNTYGGTPATIFAAIGTQSITAVTFNFSGTYTGSFNYQCNGS